MLRKLLSLCALAFLFGSCVPGTDDVVEFRENSPMYAIQNDGTLVVALPPDAAPFAALSDAGEPEGFLVDLGNHFADALEVEVEFTFMASTEMGDAVGGDNPDRRFIGDETVHLAFPLYRVTEDLYKRTSRVHGYDVTTPYFLGHQRILVPEASPVETTEDLAGLKVCELLDGVAGIPVEDLQPDADVTSRTEPSECAAALADGDVDAVAAAEPELLQINAYLQEAGDDSHRITGEEATTQGYAPFVVRGMAAFASNAFNDMRDDGRWVEAYNEWIAPVSGEEATEPPDITLEEAAALFPIEFSKQEGS